MDNNFYECLKKENLAEHKYILNKLYKAEIKDLSSDNKKTNDLFMAYKDGYIVECKSDKWCNGSIVIELVANFRNEIDLASGFYNTDNPDRSKVEETVLRFLNNNKYRSTAYFDYAENKKYLLSYIAGYGDAKSYYLLDLKALSKWIHSNWYSRLLLVNRDDSGSIMVKLFRDDFEDFLIHEKQFRTYQVL